MKQLVLAGMLIITGIINVSATRFYADPENGSMANDGSAEAPWSTLEDVWSDGKIESYYGARPFAVGDSLNVIKNEGAPVTGGDTLLLLSGYHGAISDPYGYYNKEHISIMRAPGHRPLLGQFAISSCARWRLQGLVVSPSFMPDWSLDSNEFSGGCISMIDHGFNGGSYQNEVIACTVFTEWNATGWTEENWWLDAVGGIKNSHKGYIGYCHLKNVQGGPYVSGDSSLYEYNLIENFPTDGMRMAGTANVFQYNIIKNCIKCSENHDDAIQCYPSAYSGVLRGNIVLEFDFADNDWGASTPEERPFSGELQGLFGGPWYGCTLENNLVVVDHWHGITVESRDGAPNTVVNNTVIDLVPGNPTVPWCKISGGGDGHLLANNVGHSINLSTGSTGTNEGNHILSSYDEIYELFRDPDNMGFYPKESGVLIDAGNVTYGTAFDITGAARDASPDIGAYEYTTSAVRPVTQHQMDGLPIQANPARWSDILDIPGVTVTDLSGNRITVQSGTGLYLIRQAGQARTVFIR